jgi:hypothetical protein
LFYKPTLVERKPDENGRGGRMSESGVKVAVFGASGSLGKMLCAELGTRGKRLKAPLFARRSK